MIEVLTFFLIGVMGGFLSGLLGIGGGVVLIPLLIYVGKTSIEMAASVSIVMILFASSSDFLAHHRKGNVHVPTGIWMGLAGILGALGGSILSRVFPGNFFYYLYMGLVAAAAIILVFPGSADRPSSYEYRLRKFRTLLVGLSQGFVTGVLGAASSLFLS